ncbi:MAG: hypothetical protein QNJ69_07890 [Gammaproteobacteria bacterium]|nr:hypothetical protein [Gammaproteobacteria bacterium]
MLLDEAGMTFHQPQGYAPIEIRPSELFPHEFAIKRDNNNMEIRYSIRPLARIEIDYEDPHNAAPEPNHIFNMMFTALIGQLSNGGSSPHREFQPEQAKQKFNADWAAMSLFDIDPGYSGQFQQAFLLAMHKNNLSDAYMVILFNDYQEIKPQLDLVMRSLRFK